MSNVIDAPAVAQQDVLGCNAAQAGGAVMAQAPQGAIQGAGAPPQSLSVIEQAVRTGATADQLERLLQLQVQMDNHRLALMREQRRMAEEDRRLAAELAFDEAMARFRGKNIVIPKTKEVVQTGRNGGPGPRFWQSEYDVVVSRISEALSECGLSFRHDVRFGHRDWKADGSNPAIPAGTDILIPWVWVTCILTHKAGHSIQLTLEGPADTSGAKNPLQEMQSSASFLKRQSVLAITGTPTGGEDDENAMRGRRAGPPDDDPPPPARTQQRQHPQRQEQQADTDMELRMLQAQGDIEAKKGEAALKAWWGALTTDQRKKLQAQFPAMLRTARSTH